MTTLGGVHPALFTDLYELTMAAAYCRAGIAERTATFELFVRELPSTRAFLVACGIDPAIDAIEAWHIDAAAITCLASLEVLDDDTLDTLAGRRFSGSVRAVPEGEVVFAGEPMLEITAPLVEAQLLETLLINIVAAQTMVASKAARVALAAEGRSFVDFSARRDHGLDAAMGAARAAFVGGAAGTSLVEAGCRFGLPVSGTMAHSFVMSFDDERDAFRAYARTFPTTAVLLVDTYDTLAGARRAAEVGVELAGEGVKLAGVRLDSGDIAVLASQVREVLDAAGLADVRIIASGDLDEHAVNALVAAGAPVDAFGVGTRMGTSADAPSLGMVYKLVADDEGPRMKLAAGKVTWPGQKQVWRATDHDVVALFGETVPGARPLLQEVLREGERVRPPESLPAAGVGLDRNCLAALASAFARFRE